MADGGADGGDAAPLVERDESRTEEPPQASSSSSSSAASTSSVPSSNEGRDEQPRLASDGAEPLAGSNPSHEPAATEAVSLPVATEEGTVSVDAPVDAATESNADAANAQLEGQPGPPAVVEPGPLLAHAEFGASLNTPEEPTAVAAGSSSIQRKWSRWQRIPMRKQSWRGHGYSLRLRNNRDRRRSSSS